MLAWSLPTQNTLIDILDLAEVFRQSATKTPTCIVLHSPIMKYTCSRRQTSTFLEEKRLVRDLRSYIRHSPALFVITEGDVQGPEIKRLKEYFIASSIPHNCSSSMNQRQSQITLRCLEEGTGPVLNESYTSRWESGEAATLPVFLVSAKTIYRPFLRFLNPARLPALQLMYHDTANRKIIYPQNAFPAHDQESYFLTKDFDIAVAKLVREALTWIDMRQSNGMLYSQFAPDPTGAALFGALAAITQRAQKHYKPLSTTELRQIDDVLLKLPGSTHWHPSLEPFIAITKLQLHLCQWNTTPVAALAEQHQRRVYGHPKTLVEDLKTAVSLPYRGQLRQLQYFSTLCQCQVALFDVKNVSFTMIKKGLATLKKTGPFLASTRGLDQLKPLKKEIRAYRERYPEAQADITTPGDAVTHERTRRLYFGALGTSPTRQGKLSNSSIGKEVDIQRVKFAARLHRMAAAKLWLMPLSSVTRARRFRSNIQHLSLGHALHAYRLESRLSLSLPTLSNERLTPPGSRLLMCLLGSIPKEFRFQDQIIREVYQMAVPLHSITDQNRAPKAARCIGRARGGRPRLDRGKKRYVWLHPQWKPPWAPKKPSRLEEWSWKF